jgi:exodeoxyribonuclease VII large subunit
MAKKKEKTYSVAQVNSLISIALEEGLPSKLTIEAEISGWRPHGSGHSYFSLKDANSIMPCVMWKSAVAKLKCDVKDGMAVRGRGHIDVFKPGGKYQFYVDKIEAAGVGDLQQAFEAMVEKLRSKGLFADEHKKAIPPFPMRIALVTSASGAAVKDIAESLYTRWPCAKLMIYPAAVQGAGSAGQIATAVRQLNRRNDELQIDVMIVGRGGGSMEDLWAFNEEPVAKAIYASKIPVISAVGHEIDYTIADLVADVRASTPTKAGVVAVPDIAEVSERLDGFGRRLEVNTRQRVAIATHRLENIEARSIFANPYWAVNTASQRVDEAAARLTGCAKQIFSNMREKISHAEQLVSKIEPVRLMAGKREQLGILSNAVENSFKTKVINANYKADVKKSAINLAINDVLAKKRLQITALENRLSALNPRSVLNRGYSITTDTKTGKVVTSSCDVKNGDLLRTELANENFIDSKAV